MESDYVFGGYEAIPASRLAQTECVENLLTQRTRRVTATKSGMARLAKVADRPWRVVPRQSRQGSLWSFLRQHRPT